MSIVAIGLSHRTAPLGVLERTTIAEADLPKLLADAVSRDHLSEAVVLSTCNRTEVYAYAERFHGAYSDVRDLLADSSGLAPEQFSDHIYAHYDDDAVAHLFGVAAGLRSAVIGETEILGQVRKAWDLAREEGAAATALNRLFRQALVVGKRARTETGISQHITSASQAAVALAEDELSGLGGRRVLVLGAGDMAEGTAKALQAAGVDQVEVANRTEARAVEVAERVGGRAVPMTDFARSLAGADLLLTSTSAANAVIRIDDLSVVNAARGGRPLLIVDVAVPRDVDPAVGELDGVTLLDMEDIRTFVARGLDARKGEMRGVDAIVADEVDKYRNETNVRDAAPVIAALFQHGETVRQGELERFANKLSSMSDTDRETVEALTRGIVAKLLHSPSCELKDAAGTPQGVRLDDALRRLFEL